MDFHEKLDLAAAALRLSKKDVALRSGLPQSSVYDWFAARSEPGVGAAFRLARTLNVSLDYLADPDAVGPPHEPLVPPLTAAEAHMVEEIRRMGHDTAWRRLHKLPDPTG